MKLGRFRLGMRTLKSALSVLICIWLFHVLGRGSPLIAALSAVFSLRQDLTTSVSFGKSRILGNTIGGTTALLYFYIKAYFHHDFLVELILLPILVIFVIVLSDGINNNSGIIAAIATLLLIALGVPEGGSSSFAMQRVLDTFIGTFIAVLINFVLRPPEEEKKEALKEDLTELRKKELELNQSLKEVKRKIEQNSK